MFLADHAQEIHLIKLDNDKITVNGPNLLAFDAGIDWDIKKVEGVLRHARPAACSTPSCPASGSVALLSDGPPMLIELDGDADLRRPAGRDHVVERCLDLGQDGRQLQDADRPRLRRDDADGVLAATAGCWCSPPRA